MISTNKIEYFQGSYAFLSNFYPCNMTYKGLSMPTLEHCYVLNKCGVDNVDVAIEIREMSPGKVKFWGRGRPMIAHWDLLKYHTMKRLIAEKFSEKNLDLMKKLVDTGDDLLIEGNSWGDRDWGQCPVGKGENNLGKFLMKHREKLQLDINSPYNAN